LIFYFESWQHQVNFY